MSNIFYITTAIDYPNGDPHIGHAYEKIVTDFYARWHRMCGDQVRFLTGTDENGQKLRESAEAKGQETLPFLDENVAKFINLCDSLNISYDDFIRTTEPRHQDVAKEFWRGLKEKGYIYFDKYSGHYCLACESFYTEVQAPDQMCPNHHKPLELKEEDGYFFKMSEFRDWIYCHIESHEDFICPASSRKEIVSRLKNEELRDLAISRPNVGWGIEVPDDPKYVMYTWFDALINYYSALVSKDLEQTYWPASVHVIGKDITWFHTVIWPTVLHALGKEIPQQVYVHGMVLAADGKKMSKSLDNCVDPKDLIDKYSADTLRYYIIRAFSSFGDGPFSVKELIDRHNNELANDFGNLLMRVVKFALKKIAPTIEPGESTQELFYSETFDKMNELVRKREHNKALDVAWEAVNHANQYMNNRGPWKIKDDPAKLNEIIYNLLFGIHNLAVLISPVTPTASQKVLEVLGVAENRLVLDQFGKISYHLTTPEILFEKIES